MSSGATVTQGATVTVVAGLADAGGWSLQTLDGRYLRHSGSRIVADVNDGTAAFAQDATFHAVPGSAAGSVRLTSHNLPGRCIRHRDFALWLDIYDLAGGTFPADSSFRALNPWA